MELAGGRVPLIVAGDSAGGNLSAVVAQRPGFRRPELALQVLVYPVTDCDFDTTTYLDPDNQMLLTRESMAWFWDHYAPDVAARKHPDAVAAARHRRWPACRPRSCSPPSTTSFETRASCMQPDC